MGVSSTRIEPDAEDPQARLAGAKALRLELEGIAAGAGKGFRCVSAILA